MIAPAPLGLFLIVIAGLLAVLVVVFGRASQSGFRMPLIVVLIWVAATGATPFVFQAIGLGASGQFPTFAATLIATIVLALSSVGTRVVAANGLALLAAIQVFRFPLEYVLIVWYDAGFMPVQMTWRGENFDVITGLLALPAAVLIARGFYPNLIAFIFNAFGLAMLVKIIWIVANSSPTPLRQLTGGYETGPDVLVGLYFPTVWIASIAVAGAFFLHTASLAHVLRRIRRSKDQLAKINPEE